MSDKVDPFTEEQLVEPKDLIPPPLPDSEGEVDPGIILAFEEEITWSGGRRGLLLQNLWEELSANGRDISDPSVITEEMNLTPGKMAMWGALQAEQEANMEKAQLKYDIWHAIRAGTARSELKKGATASFQPTDKAVEAWIIDRYEDEYTEWQLFLIDAKRVLGHCKQYVKSWDARARLLQSIGALNRSLFEGAEAPTTLSRKGKSEGEL